ncbi:hypothetical protein HG531_012645 [Fusarium graminearum]|nr:hypothetical protein HG531_012645 [Fusarium graminearum]
MLNRSLLVAGLGALPLGVLLPPVAGLITLLDSPNFGISELKRGTSPNLGSSTPGPGVSVFMGGGSVQVALEGLEVTGSHALRHSKAMKHQVKPEDQQTRTLTGPRRGKASEGGPFDRSMASKNLATKNDKYLPQAIVTSLRRSMEANALTAASA